MAIKKQSMKKTIFWITIFLLIILALLFIFRKSFISKLVFDDFHPRNPKNEIEVTYEIGWWSYQDELKIDSFQVQTIESKLNLFNSQSLISYTIKGKLIGKKGWKPSVKKIHISERFIRYFDRDLHPYLEKDTNNLPEAIIEITPIVGVKENDKYDGDTIQFNFTNELIVHSFHWGNNWIRFQTSEKYKDLILQQRK